MPTVWWPGLLAPFLRPFCPTSTSAAFRSSHEVCGVRMSKWNDRSPRTMTLQGSGVPVLMCCVRALNSYEIKAVSEPGAVVDGVRSKLNQRSVVAHLTEIHRFDTLATQRRTNGGAGTGLAGTNNQLHELISRNL